MLLYTEVKNVLGIATSDTTKDSRITALIPWVIEFACKTLRTRFPGDIEVSGDGISFTASTKKIADTDAGFEDIIPGIEIYVSGTLLNDGFYTVSAATSSEITVSETLKDEVAGRTVTITNVVFSQALKLTLSKIIGFFLQNDPVGYSSQTIGPLNWDFVNAGAIPQNLISELYTAAGKSQVGGL